MAREETDALRRSVVAALAYFDLFDHPLTLVELCRYRYRARATPSTANAADVRPSDVLSALDAAGVGSMDGYFFLPGREAIVATRKRRGRMAERKFARARAVAAAAKFLPSVRMIAVCNSLAISGADRESDIDLFVIARPGTVWITRFIVVTALAVLGLRPDERSHADKVCMSFFVSENAMDLSSLAMGDDVYLRYWIASLVPVYEAGGTHDAFMRANAWVREALPGLAGPSRRVGAEPRWTTALLPLMRMLEAPARNLQSRMFPADINALANADTRVVVSADILKFHVNDRRQEFARRFGERMRALDAAPSSARETAAAIQTA